MDEAEYIYHSKSRGAHVMTRKFDLAETLEHRHRELAVALSEATIKLPGDKLFLIVSYNQISEIRKWDV